MNSRKILVLNPKNRKRDFERTIDDLVSEINDQDCGDAGFRIREYAITPGRVLRTLNRMTGNEEGDDKRIVR